MKQHSKAVRAASARSTCILDQPRHASRIHGVINKQVRSQKRWGDHRRIEATHADRGRIDEDVGIFEFLPQSLILKRNRHQALDRPAQMLGLEKRREFFFERFDFFKRAVHEHQTLAAFPRTLHGNRPPGSAASSQQHDSQIPHIHAEFLADRANEPRPVGVEAVEFFADDHDGIHAPRGPRVVIRHIHRC